MTSSNQNGWDRKYALKEADFHEKKLPDDIGVGWKDLARTLGFSESSIDIIEKEKNSCDKECCIRVLVCWLHKEGGDATAEKIYEALVRIGRKILAERFQCKPSDPSQNPEAVIHDLEEKLAKTSARSKELEAEVDKLSARNKKLEDEVSTLRARNKELEKDKQQKGECEGNDASKEAEQEEREKRVSEILEKCKEDLETYVTQPLVVPEVRYDNLPTAIAVDVLKVISQHLEEQYNTALDIAPAACQCSEDLRKCFHDFAYRALQAENNEMNLKIKNMKKTLREATKDDKEEFENLKRLRKRRKDLVVKLEKWQDLFSQPEASRRFTHPTGKKREHSHNKEKRRDTFPKRNKERDDWRDEEKSLLPNDNEGEEDVEGPPK
ncbi:PREDICTED: myosin-10-like isoform X3 [Acropora digitifera]|uniref:myosin-10-like isoform X3 n=1 Tax=Acropora digitifera TaxID=70779 RepID=UPI00077AF3BC|nr:PREDICTED: myosin-10-like isoform X3 [Acropora digitifera]